jgi:hypothetical protein
LAGCDLAIMVKILLRLVCSFHATARQHGFATVGT